MIPSPFLHALIDPPAAFPCRLNVWLASLARGVWSKLRNRGRMGVRGGQFHPGLKKGVEVDSQVDDGRCLDRATPQSQMRRINMPLSWMMLPQYSEAASCF